MNKIDGFIELLIDLTNKDKIVWKEVNGDDTRYSVLTPSFLVEYHCQGDGFKFRKISIFDGNGNIICKYNNVYEGSTAKYLRELEFSIFEQEKRYINDVIEKAKSELLQIANAK